MILDINKYINYYEINIYYKNNIIYYDRENNSVLSSINYACAPSMQTGVYMFSYFFFFSLSHICEGQSLPFSYMYVPL